MRRTFLGTERRELPKAKRIDQNMDFVLTGFRQDANIRRFAFQRVATDHSRTEFTVSADMTLLVKHKIPLQELPLLCRALLEDQNESGPAKAVIFSETDMLVYVQRRTTAKDEADRKRAQHRSPFVKRPPRPTP
jgi:hypothetical protein